MDFLVKHIDSSSPAIGRSFSGCHGARGEEGFCLPEMKRLSGGRLQIEDIGTAFRWSSNLSHIVQGAPPIQKIASSRHQTPKFQRLDNLRLKAVICHNEPFLWVHFFSHTGNLHDSV